MTIMTITEKTEHALLTRLAIQNLFKAILSTSDGTFLFLKPKAARTQRIMGQHLLCSLESGNKNLFCVHICIYYMHFRITLAKKQFGTM